MADTLTFSVAHETKQLPPDDHDGATSCLDLELEAHSVSSMDSSPGTLDWAATLSPVERSCIDLSTIEPCVKKAVANLESLKETMAFLEQQGRGGPLSPILSPAPSPIPPPVPARRMRPSSVRLCSIESACSDLSVEGVRTGIKKASVILERYRRPTLARTVSDVRYYSTVN
jgi:hypothetical protein